MSDLTDSERKLWLYINENEPVEVESIIDEFREYTKNQIGATLMNLVDKQYIRSTIDWRYKTLQSPPLVWRLQYYKEKYL